MVHYKFLHHSTKLWVIMLTIRQSYHSSSQYNELGKEQICKLFFFLFRKRTNNFCNNTKGLTRRRFGNKLCHTIF
uniref:Uncharacterized protein n=1 Tax=Rhizophora mucronata TaxID=61149 RepID=A0A2P2QL73_RHIMU